MTHSYRVPLFAVVSCLALVACNQTGSPSATPAQAASPASGMTEPAPASPADAVPPTGPTTLTEIDQASLAAKLASSGSCSFDKIDGEPIANAGAFLVAEPSNFSILGWVVDRTEMTRPDAVLRLQEVNGGRGWEIGVGPGTRRADVGRYLKNDGLSNAGFDLKADLGALPPGEYALSLNYASGERRVACDKDSKIVIGG